MDCNLWTKIPLSFPFPLHYLRVISNSTQEAIQVYLFLSALQCYICIEDIRCYVTDTAPRKGQTPIPNDMIPHDSRILT
jgi:hypothetical protein